MIFATSLQTTNYKRNWLRAFQQRGCKFNSLWIYIGSFNKDFYSLYIYRSLSQIFLQFIDMSIHSINFFCSLWIWRSFQQIFPSVYKYTGPFNKNFLQFMNMSLLSTKILHFRYMSTETQFKDIEIWNTV